MTSSAQLVCFMGAFDDRHVGMRAAETIWQQRMRQVRPFPDTHPIWPIVDHHEPWQVEQVRHRTHEWQPQLDALMMQLGSTSDGESARSQRHSNAGSTSVRFSVCAIARASRKAN
eukprot:CAMPEP_0195605768 /NCGR_PEP_ID=MMETSP0815-20121206/7328_1 /TAXON_ID=97485 /ORGANISM="Prymnesium parvum, Strain Texoma1" /LENGTH=114 /DNA_ID=CAMNT_0040745465 /DNA_START=540 /DNA_END=882 /DNA_ORIENTATION=+